LTQRFFQLLVVLFVSHGNATQDLRFSIHLQNSILPSGLCKNVQCFSARERNFWGIWTTCFV